MSRSVRIHYHRPPARTEMFEQELLFADESVIVTFLAHTPLARPLIIDGRSVLEPGSPAIWFTFPGLMHDVGRFHTADGVFTGFYANILTPVQMASAVEWSTTDLYLDVWVGVDGVARVIDDEELEEALNEGWIAPDTGDAARAEANRILALCQAGAWPPQVVNEWPIERVSKARRRDGRAVE